MKRLLYYVPLQGGRTLAQVTPTLLNACIEDGHLPEGTEDFPKGTKIHMMEPSQPSKKRGEPPSDPKWGIEIPTQKKPGRAEMEEIIELGLHVLSLQKLYFKTPKVPENVKKDRLVAAKAAEVDFVRRGQEVLTRSRGET